MRKTKNIKKVDIDSPIKEIGKEAFKGDQKLKNIELNGDSLKKVGKNAFTGIAKNATIKIDTSKKKYAVVIVIIKKSSKLPKGVKFKRI